MRHFWKDSQNAEYHELHLDNRLPKVRMEYGRITRDVLSDKQPDADGMFLANLIKDIPGLREFRTEPSGYVLSVQRSLAVPAHEFKSSVAEGVMKFFLLSDGVQLEDDESIGGGE